MKKIFITFILLVAAIFLAGCDGDFGKEDTIKFSWWGTSERNVATHRALKLFTEKTGIKVEPDQKTWSGYQTVLYNYLERGNEADVFQINYNWIYSMDGADYFYDINELGIDFSKYPESEHKPLTVDGKVLGLSISETGYIFYLNKDVYEEAGAEIPTTWDELIEAGKKIKAHNPNKYALGRLDAQQASILMYSYLAQKYGKNVIEGDKFAFTKEELIEGLNFLDDLRSNNVLIENLQNDTHQDGPTNPNWINYENYGGILQWNTAVSEYQNTLPKGDEKMITAGMFQINKGEQLGMYKKVSMAYAVSTRVAKSETKKENVKKFLEFMTTDPEAVEILGVDRGVPSHSGAREQLAKIPEFKNSLEWTGHDIVQTYYNNQLTKEQNLYIHPYYEHETFRNVYEQPLQKFLFGTQNVEQTANEILRTFDTNLQKVMEGR